MIPETASRNVKIIDENNRNVKHTFLWRLRADLCLTFRLFSSMIHILGSCFLAVSHAHYAHVGEMKTKQTLHYSVAA